MFPMAVQFSLQHGFRKGASNFARRLLLGVGLLFALPLSIQAHPFHESKTEIRRNVETGRLEIAVMFHAEDLINALADQRLPSNLKDQAELKNSLKQYLEPRFLLTSASGDNIQWKMEGCQLEKVDLWVYLETAPVESLEGINIAQRALFEMEEGQSNLVRLEDGESRWAFRCTPENASFVVTQKDVQTVASGDAEQSNTERAPTTGASDAAPAATTNTPATSAGSNTQITNNNAHEVNPKRVVGRVFHDQNGDRLFNVGEPVLPGVRVSNGREVTRTAPSGEYSLPIDDDDAIFVIKPRGWRTPLNERNLPQFYYLHKPNGSPEMQFKGVAPTGPLPDSVDFALYPQDEPDRFDVLLYGDTQPRDEKEMDYLLHDVIEECIGTDAAFGVTLGDLVFDDLSVLENYTRGVALVGVPWYNVIGNHDINYDAKNDEQSDETFERYFGPSYYSFDYGPTHFLVLDDIEWLVKKNEEGKESGEYRGGLGERQMAFVRNDLAETRPDQMVVLLMHIPLVEVQDRQELYRMIENRPFSLSISAHTHYHRHVFINSTDDWRGPKPHHHIVNVTTCGSWWSGKLDERGIPHTLMRCGAPNGYTTLSFDGTDYHLRYKAAAFSADYQMIVHAPNTVKQGETVELLANVFNALPTAKVEFKLGEGGEWRTMEPAFDRIDPAYQKLVEEEKKLGKVDWITLPKLAGSGHLWSAKWTMEAEKGTQLIHVRATDPVNGQVHGKRGVRIVVDP